MMKIIKGKMTKGMLICFCTGFTILIVTFLYLSLHLSKWENTEHIVELTHPAVGSRMEAFYKQYDTVDYFETYRMALPEDFTKSLRELKQMMSNSAPDWINTLMEIRNVIVAPFGLKTGKEENHRSKGDESESSIPILEQYEDEIIFGENDKHLFFAYSVFIEEKGNTRYFYVTTFVVYNNMMGDTYFFAVKPVHRYMINSMLLKMEKKLWGV